MRFTIDKSKFISGIQHLHSIVPTKNITPILTNLLIEADADKDILTITSTDLEITVIVKTIANVAESGKIAVSARNLLEIVSALEDKPVNFQKENEYVKIKCSHANFSLLCADHTQFPMISDINLDSALTINAPMFAKMVSIAGIAVLQEMTRPIFSGILWRLNPQNQVMVSTDGKKIVEVKKEQSLDIAEPKEHVVPTKGLHFLEKVITDENPEMKILFDQNRIVFSYLNYTVISQIIPGRFPDYEKVLNVNNSNTLIIDKSILRQAVRRISLLASEEFYRIKFDVSDSQIIVSSVNSEMGDATEEITDFEYTGSPFAVAFNYKYILSILGVLETDKVRITFGEPENGIVNSQSMFYNHPELTDYRALILLMPLRLK
jgi:DNA polymerase III subunit beta